MTTAWTLTASEICTDAMQHLGHLDPGESASGNDMQLALRGLDAVLKELPLAGYTWPKLSAETTLTWASLQTISLPSDYYGNPIAWKTLNGQRVPLTQIPHATWVQMIDRAATGEATHFYVNPSNVFYVWPVPSSDPGMYVQYQKIVDDAELAVSPDVLQTWKNALGYGVANEIGLKLGATQERRVEIAQRWSAKRSICLLNSIPAEAISFEVRGL
jgi:hypothetical protein